MLRFRHTCARHQRAFIEAARRGGCDDPVIMDEVRRKALVWLSTKFPRMVLDHFNEANCLGCKLEENGVDLRDLERIIIDLSAEAAPNRG